MHFRTIYIFFITVIIFNSALAQKNSVATKKYSIQELSEDMKILEDILLAHHPSIRFYHPEEWYKNYFDTALVLPHSLNEKEFRMFLKKKLSQLHCGHSAVIPSRKYERYLKKKEFRAIPYYLSYYEPYFINIKGFGKSDTLLKPFDTIKTINQVPIFQIAEQFQPYLFVDGMHLLSQNEMLQKNLMFYYFANTDIDSVMLELNATSSPPKTLHTKTFKHLQNELWKMKSDTLMQKYGGKYYCGVYLDKNKKIFYMKIKAFSGISMKAFFRKTFKRLKHHQAQVLILDLRNNPGGKITQCLNLLSYLLPQKDSLFYETRIQKLEHKKYLSRKLEFRIINWFMKITKAKNKDIWIEPIKKNKSFSFNHTLYVITNCNTFSAANLVAVYLANKRPHTKIVGTVTSGAQWGSNAVSFLKLTLPNTKIRIIIPTFRIYHNLKHLSNPQKMQSVMPNIYPNYTPSDYFFKKDKALESIYFDLMNK